MPAPLTSVSVVLNASGAGTAEVTPGRYGIRWRINRMVTSATNQCVLRVYLGTVSAGTLIDSSKSGQSDTSEIVDGLMLNATDKLVFAYSAGTPGDRATCVLWGDVGR